MDASPVGVADEIVRVLALPFGEKPFRSVVDYSDAHVDIANEALRKEREGFVERMGFGELLKPA